MVDGDFQELASANDGALTRKMLIGNDNLSAGITTLLADYTDDQLNAPCAAVATMQLKVYAAYERAVRSDKPVAIIVQTVKGYGMGKAAEGKNKAHQTKDISDDFRVETKNRYQIPISDDEARDAKFWFPGPADPAEQNT
jgi:pyruvate dehydrogenase E1 component